VGIVALFFKCAPECFIWGAGTAAGEIPPYWVSYLAASSGKASEEMQEIEELETTEVAWWDYFSMMKRWMVRFLKQHGFMGVFIMSAWPNAAFDLCGICCGHFMMPFWTFFGATLAGKAGVKSMLQCLFFVIIFSPGNIDAIMGMIEAARLSGVCSVFGAAPCHMLLKEQLSRAILQFENPGAFLIRDGTYGVKDALIEGGKYATGGSCEQLFAHLKGANIGDTDFSQELLCSYLAAAQKLGFVAGAGTPVSYSATTKLTQGEPILKWLFGCVVMMVVFFFLVTTIEQFAQMYAEELDEEEIEGMKKTK